MERRRRPPLAMLRCSKQARNSSSSRVAVLWLIVLHLVERTALI
jgi:hypothetical protein